MAVSEVTPRFGAARRRPGRGVGFSTATLELDKILARLAAETSFTGGRELVLALEPSAEAWEVERRQRATAEARHLPTIKPGMSLAGVTDVRPLATRGRLGGILQPGELLQIGSTCRSGMVWRDTLTRLRDALPTLARVAEPMGDHRALAADITECIRETEEVADGASPELRQIRSSLRSARDRLLNRLQELLQSSAFRPMLQDPVVTQRNGRYVVPVKAEYRGRLKGIVHDQSASGATLFVEPLPIVEAGNRVRELEAAEAHEVERILRALSNAVGAQADELIVTVSCLAQLDLHLACGRLAEEMRATPARLLPFDPERSDRPSVRLVRARHPLLTGDVVPLSLELGREFDVLVITGPNTGGKTVALKTLGLLALMAQCGLDVPADQGCELPIFPGIFADIGDEQSIEQSLSTFSSHVRHIADMLGALGPNSLVLLDEVGAGTDPQEGSALARALLTELGRRGAYVVATTHYSELKAFAHATPRIENASVEFDVESLAPTYRLLVGVPGQSNAFAIAERLGIPHAVIEEARGLIDPEAASTEALLDAIRREKQEAELRARHAEDQLQRAETLRKRARQELREAERQRKITLHEARQEAEKLLADFRAQVAERVDRLDAARESAAALRREVSRPVELPSGLQVSDPRRLQRAEREQELAATLRVGAEIVAPTLGIPGRIISISPSGDAELDVRGMRVRVKASELEGARAATRDDRQAVARESVPPLLTRSKDAPAAPPTQIDLRGLRASEATEQLDRYLNDAYLSGLRSVRVVHGKGTGAVRTAVRQQLAAHALVARFGGAENEAGGEGVTEVVLAR
ncbi:MAG: endonuclease MutS2 [Chloroflexota bacterium]